MKREQLFDEFPAGSESKVILLLLCTTFPISTSRRPSLPSLEAVCASLRVLHRFHSTFIAHLVKEIDLQRPNSCQEPLRAVLKELKDARVSGHHGRYR